MVSAENGEPVNGELKKCRRAGCSAAFPRFTASGSTASQLIQHPGRPVWTEAFSLKKDPYKIDKQKEFKKPLAETLAEEIERVD